MASQEHFLSIRLAGQAIGAARIPVNHLIRLLEAFNKALFRTGRVLQGQADSVRRGPVQHSIKDEIALDLIEITHGSPATVLGLDRSCGQRQFECMDFGLEIIEKSLKGLQSVQTDSTELPPGFDPGVVLAWRDLGIMFEQGVSEMRFRLNHSTHPLVVDYTTSGYQRVQERVQLPQVNIRTIEGRLLMVDLKEHGTRCRIHPSAGDPILCLFDDSRKEEVLENITKYVKVIGEAKEDPISGKITSIQLHDIQRLENREEERKDLLPQGTPLPHDFWRALSLDELAESQAAVPLQDVTVLFGTWPGDIDDGFEELIRELRKRNVAGEVSR
jgi:hypothetical protein